MWIGGVNIKSFTLRMSDKLHRKLKTTLFEKEVSIQQYLIGLIKKDLDFSDDDDDLSDYLPSKK